jgi:hypothetical protein
MERVETSSLKLLLVVVVLVVINHHPSSSLKTKQNSTRIHLLPRIVTERDLGFVEVRRGGRGQEIGKGGREGGREAGGSSSSRGC